MWCVRINTYFVGISPDQLHSSCDYSILTSIGLFKVFFTITDNLNNFGTWLRDACHNAIRLKISQSKYFPEQRSNFYLLNGSNINTGIEKNDSLNMKQNNLLP